MQMNVVNISWRPLVPDSNAWVSGAPKEGEVIFIREQPKTLSLYLFNPNSEQQQKPPEPYTQQTPPPLPPLPPQSHLKIEQPTSIPLPQKRILAFFPGEYPAASIAVAVYGFRRDFDRNDVADMFGPHFESILGCRIKCSGSAWVRFADMHSANQAIEWSKVNLPHVKVEVLKKQPPKHRTVKKRWPPYGIPRP